MDQQAVDRRNTVKVDDNDLAKYVLREELDKMINLNEEQRKLVEEVRRIIGQGKNEGMSYE